jgi:hypothetical protein
MPIVFHFKDERTGDPQQQSLEPKPGEGEEGGGRLASPILLKPLILSNGQAFPMLVRLTTDLFEERSEGARRLGQLVLKQENQRDICAPLGGIRADNKLISLVEKRWGMRAVRLV